MVNFAYNNGKLCTLMVYFPEYLIQNIIYIQYTYIAPEHLKVNAGIQPYSSKLRLSRKVES